MEFGWKGGESEAPQMGDGVLEVSEKWRFEEIAGGGEGFFHYHWSTRWRFGGFQSSAIEEEGELQLQLLQM